MIHAQKLHDEFVRLGGARLKLKNKMLAMLPEIYENGIWKKYAGSIEEYAGKYGDIAKTTVIKRLRLEGNLKDKPCLKAAIEKVGVHKIALVAKIATPETDSIMAENVVSMSKMAVQSLSKELRAEQKRESVHDSAEDSRQLVFGDGGFVHHTPLCSAVSITKKIELNENSTFLFMKLKTKLGKNLSDKEFLEILLEERAKQEFSQAISPKNVTGDTNEAKPAVANGSSASRYIPADKKREVIAQTNGKCTYPNCHAPFQVLHHVDRYRENRTHDSIIPLCKIHHEFAHHNLIRGEALKSDQWRISIFKAPAEKISQADVLYRKYRQKTLEKLQKNSHTSRDLRPEAENTEREICIGPSEKHIALHV